MYLLLWKGGGRGVGGVEGVEGVGKRWGEWEERGGGVETNK
jgi:hypothetical protein